MALDTHSIYVRISDGRVTSYHNWKISAERSARRRRDVSLKIQTEDEARAEGVRLLDSLGLSDEFEVESVTLDPEEVSSRDPSRMKSYGTAHVKAKKVGDPPTLQGGNGWHVSFDRFDGAVLSYGMSDHLRFIEEPGDIGETGARRVAEGIWAAVDADDPTQYPADWRRVSSVQKGWCIAGPQWAEQYRSAHGREPEIGAILQAYKVSFSNPFWPGQDEFDYVFLRASNGELMHDGRF